MKNTFTKTIIVLFSFFFNYSALAQSPLVGLVITTVPNTGFTNGEQTYRLYAELSSGIVTQMFGDETREHSIVTTTAFFNEQLSGAQSNLQSEVNTGAFGTVPGLEWDTWTTLGDSYTSGPSTVGDVGFGLDLSGPSWTFGGDVNSDASIFRLPNDPLCTPDANGLVLLGQFTTNGVLSGFINLSGLDNGNPWEANQIPIPENQVTISGCTDPLACNYIASSTFDDGSCDYITCVSPLVGLVITTVPNTGFNNDEQTYRLYAELSSGIVTQMFGDETRPHSIVTTTAFLMSSFQVLNQIFSQK
jgi:hypothetical protein